MTLLPPVYLPRATPRIQFIQSPFTSPTQPPVRSQWLQLRTMIQTTHLLWSEAHKTLPTSWTAVLLFSSSKSYLSFPTRISCLSNQNAASLMAGITPLFMSPMALRNAISYTEWACNKYMFLDNWLLLSSFPLPHEEFSNPSTQINAPIFFSCG